MAKNTRNFLVSYNNEPNAWGYEGRKNPITNEIWIHLMTLNEAKKFLKTMPCKNPIIVKLEPLK